MLIRDVSFWSAFSSRNISIGVCLLSLPPKKASSKSSDRSFLLAWVRFQQWMTSRMGQTTSQFPRCSMGMEYLPAFASNLSGQIIIFHQPRSPWNKGISLTKPLFGVSSCEVAIIWLKFMVNVGIHIPHGANRFGISEFLRLVCDMGKNDNAEAPMWPFFAFTQ